MIDRDADFDGHAGAALPLLQIVADLDLVIDSTGPSPLAVGESQVEVIADLHHLDERQRRAVDHVVGCRPERPLAEVGQTVAVLVGIGTGDGRIGELDGIEIESLPLGEGERCQLAQRATVHAA